MDLTNKDCLFFLPPSKTCIDMLFCVTTVERTSQHILPTQKLLDRNVAQHVKSCRLRVPAAHTNSPEQPDLPIISVLVVLTSLSTMNLSELCLKMSFVELMHNLQTNSPSLSGKALVFERKTPAFTFAGDFTICILCLLLVKLFLHTLSQI